MDKLSNTSPKENKLYEIKETLYDGLLDNIGIKKILKLAHNYLNNTITICNSNFSIINTYPENQYLESIDDKNGTLYVPLAELRSMQEEKLMSKIFEAHNAFFFNSKYQTYHMIFCPIRIRKSVIGYICIQDTNRNFEETDLKIVDILSGILSLEMQKYDFYTGSYNTQLEYILSDLIEKTTDNIEYLKNRIKQLGHTLLANCWILIISGIDENTIESLNINYLQKQLQNIFPKDLITYYNQHLTILITKDSNKPFTELEECTLENFLHYNSFVGSLSYCCTNLLDLRHYYHQAFQLIHSKDIITEAAISNQYIIYYEDKVTNSLLSRCRDRYFLSAAVHPDILFLIKYDKNHNSELFFTFRIYLEQNRNALNASKALHIHKSTFFYRLNRIIELLEISLDDSNRLYNYELSLHILDYLNSSKNNQS